MTITKAVLINIQAVSPLSTFATAAATGAEAVAGAKAAAGNDLEFCAYMALPAIAATRTRGKRSFHDAVD
jgi:hypothetical protein